MSTADETSSVQRSVEPADANGAEPQEEYELSTDDISALLGRDTPMPPNVEGSMTAEDPLLLPENGASLADHRGRPDFYRTPTRPADQVPSRADQVGAGQNQPWPDPVQASVDRHPMPTEQTRSRQVNGRDMVTGYREPTSEHDRAALQERIAHTARSRPLITSQEAQKAGGLTWPMWLARAAAMILPAALLLAAIVWFVLRTLLSVTAPETTTVTRIVLTDQVRWPFFDTVIEEAGDLARSDDLASEVAQAFPNQDYVLEAEVPTAVDAIIDVTVQAEDETLSRDASVMAATWVVDKHEGRRVEETRRTLDPLNAERERVLEQKATEEARADQILRDRQGELDEGIVGRLDRELRLANNAISFYDSELLRLDSSINEVNGSLESMQPEIAIGSINTSTSTDGTSSLPFQAAVATFLLSGFGLFVANRELGRFGDSKHLQSVLEVPVVPWTSSQANVQLARLVRMAQDEVACQIVGFDSEVTTPSAVAVSNALADLGVPSQYLRPGVVPTDPDVVYLQAAGDSPLRSDTLKGLVWCDAVLLVADSQRDSIRNLRRRLRRYREMGIPPLAIISVDRDRTGPRYPVSGLVR